MFDINEVVDKYYKRIYKLCLFYLNNEQDAEDATQQVFIKIMEKQKSFKGKSNIYTWIYRIAVNSTINMLRRKKIIQFLSLRANGSDIDIPEFDKNPADKLEKEELKQIQQSLFENSLGMLSHREKTALFLFQYEKMKQKEIAEIMETSISAVEALTHKAMKKIKLSIAKNKPEM